jgi:hypothetical protein
MASTSSDFPHNNYATKKTITQGLLDLALLTANVAQLKMLLDAGPAYRYYVVLMTLVCVSITLQVVRGCLNVVLGALYNIVDESHQQAATVLNNIVLVLGVLTGVVNSITSFLDMSEEKGT